MWSDCPVSLRSWGYNCPNAEKYGHIILNYTVVANSSVITRGMTLAVIDIQNCKATDVRNFDTHGSAAEAVKLRNFLQQLPAGTLVAFVNADESFK